MYIKKLYLLLALCFLVSCNSSEEDNPIAESNPFDHRQLIGHMGDCANAPENTIPSFSYALDTLGLHWFECDPNVTKDGQIVLNHMATIDSHSTGKGKISEMTLNELLQYDFGNPAKFGDKYKDTKICTAREALQFAKLRNAIIEFDFSHFTVTKENVQQLYDMVISEGYEHNTIFEPQTEEHINVIAQVTTSIPIIYVGMDSTLNTPPNLYKFPLVVIGLNHRKLGNRSDLAEKIHSLGFKAASGVINPTPENPKEKMKFLFGIGFDYVYSENIAYSEIPQ